MHIKMVKTASDCKGKTFYFHARCYRGPTQVLWIECKEFGNSIFSTIKKDNQQHEKKNGYIYLRTLLSFSNFRLPSCGKSSINLQFFLLKEISVLSGLSPRQVAIKNKI